LSIDKKTSLFNDWLKRFGIPLQTLQSVFDAYYGDTKTKYPNLTESELQNRALTRVYTYCQRSQETKAVNCTLFGDTGIVDWVSIRIGAAKATYRRDKELAIKSELTNADGTPIDNRPKLWDGTPNPGYRKPLEGQKFERTIFGFNEESPIIRIRVWDEAAQTIQVPLNRQVQFYGKPRKTEREAEVEFALVSTFQVLNEKEEPNLKEILLGHPWYVPFSDIPKCEKKSVISMGDVINITFFEKRNTVSVGDFEMEHTLRLNVDKSHPINFGIDSKILFGARINPKYQPKGNKYSGNSYFIYPLPEFLIPPNVQAPIFEAKGPVPTPTSFTPVPATSTQETKENKDEKVAKWLKNRMKPK